MKDFALKHPFITSFTIFLIVLIGGNLVGFIYGALIMGDCKPVSPSDPCDAGAMMFVSISIISFIASLILSIVAWILTFIVLMILTSPPKK